MRQGFTLIECTLTIVVIGIVAVIFVGKINGVRDAATTITCLADMESFAAEVEDARNSQGHPPPKSRFELVSTGTESTRTTGTFQTTRTPIRDMVTISTAVTRRTLASHTRTEPASQCDSLSCASTQLTGITAMRSTASRLMGYLHRSCLTASSDTPIFRMRSGGLVKIHTSTNG